jgi:hypothetical protein
MPAHVHSTEQMIDIRDPQEEVEVTLRDGKLWVNVDGICRLRIVGIKTEVLNVNYSPKEWLVQF